MGCSLRSLLTVFDFDNFCISMIYWLKYTQKTWSRGHTLHQQLLGFEQQESKKDITHHYIFWIIFPIFCNEALMTVKFPLSNIWCGCDIFTISLPAKYLILWKLGFSLYQYVHIHFVKRNYWPNIHFRVNSFL